ncbi:glycoside hydrolase family 88/105 protein [Croceivirga radicis]|uniref:glycoside hydrolase family 88/105 protein n=1 Tax=Croceivirga radicis TaxID=1929488 RepID=UPI0002FAA8A1|nr:glycoside hydrolase family 88 protein [Croceivirga radicis]
MLVIACKDVKKETLPARDEPKVLVSQELPWSERMALSIMQRNPKAWQTENDSIPKWNYKIGLLCTAYEQLYKRTQDDTYLGYIQDYAEAIIDSTGIIYGYEMQEYNIDMINSGKMLFWLYNKTKDVRYKKALDQLRAQLIGHPRTPSNGFWHKKIYPNQMWLDGLYMGAPFYAQYNTVFKEGDKLDDIAHQFELIWEKTYDAETGLLFHAWDESKQMAWADKTTGKSPNFWSRSLGWYVMALVDVLDFFPANHPKRPVLEQQLVQLSAAILKFQDDKGVWYQVPNLPDRTGNYLESSGTCMFAYAFAKGSQKGYLSKEYLTIANTIFDGIVKEFITVEPNGLVNINKVCKSAGLGGNPYRDGSFEYYMSEPVVTNNLHGTGPFILAANQLNR